MTDQIHDSGSALDALHRAQCMTGVIKEMFFNNVAMVNFSTAWLAEMALITYEQTQRVIDYIEAQRGKAAS